MGLDSPFSGLAKIRKLVRRWGWRWGGSSDLESTQIRMGVNLKWNICMRKR